MQLVSVIIPTYNRAHCVARAIQSALNQTYHNLEIIVVDDGSLDNTSEVIAKFGKKVCYLLKQNGGVSSARNHGIRHCTGEIVAFLDSDDLWLPNKLEKQIAFLAQHPDFGMVLCDCDFIDLNGTRSGCSNRRSDLPRDGRILNEVLLAPSLIPSSVLVRKELLYQVGLFDETLRTAEDLDLHLKLARVTNIALIAESLFVVMHGHEGLSMLSRTYDDNVYVVENFLQQYGSDFTETLQRKTLCRTYMDAANGKFWKKEWLLGCRYGVRASMRASVMDYRSVVSMWLKAAKSFVHHAGKRLWR